MALNKEQISELKKQLHEQIKHLPENKRKEAEAQINEMSDTAIEEMLEVQKSSQVRIFREIISGKIPSKKIDENDSAIAVLEIKPISKGHTIIIPKDAIEIMEKIPEAISKFAEKVAKNISDRLRSKNVKMSPELKFGECIINLIPIYDKELSLKDERTSPSEEELDKIIEELKKEPIKKEEPKEETKKEHKPELKKFPRRIP